MTCSTEVTRLLVEFGVAEAIVGADALSRREPGVGAAVDLGPGCAQAAAAHSLAPALAILLASDRDPEAVARMRAAGLDTLVLEPRRLNDVVAAHFRVEAALGRKGRAVASTTRLAREISTVASGRNLGDAPRPRVVWVLERAPLVVVGNDGLLHELLELAGGENAFHGRSAARLEATLDEIAAARPDFVLDSSAAGEPLPLPGGLEQRRIPPELATVPALDVVPRVRRLHFTLVPDEAAAGL